MNGPGLLRYAILCAMFFLSGCAYISPHIKTDAPIVEAKSGNIMPNLEASIAKVDAWRKDTDNHDDWITVTRRSLDVTTFGLVAAIGVHSIHGAAVNAIKNLALSAGLVYTGENLFFSADQAKLYSTASGALQCISNRGVALRAVVRDQSVGASSNLPVEYKELVLSPPSCTPDPITKKAFDAARLARRAAIVAVEQAAQADITSAAKVETAARNVIRELNTQLDATAPSSASILNSAKSAIALAKAFTPATGAALAPAGGPGGGPTPCGAAPPEILDELRKRLNDLVIHYNAIETSIGAALNGIGSLDTACSFTPTVIPPIALSQTEVTVIKDSSFTVVISGGKEPYSWTSVGADLGSDVRVQLVIPNTLIISGTSQTTAGQSYTVHVTDSSIAPKPAILKITTK